jgi:hypothetical protein
MKILKINDKEYYLKDKWSELTMREFNIVCASRSKYLFTSADMIEFNAIRISLFKFLTNVPNKIYNNITSVEWVDILPFLNCWFKTPTLEKSFYPTLRIGFKKYYGPIGMCEAVTMEELAQVDTVFAKASNIQSKQALVELAAYLYRPKRSDISEFKRSSKWNGDVREKFNVKHCKNRFKHFRNLPDYKLVAIYLYYWSFREAHLLKFERVFKNTSGKSGKSDNRGWAGTILEIAHLPVFGNMNEVSQQDWFTVLYEMDRQLEKAQELETKYGNK